MPDAIIRISSNKIAKYIKSNNIGNYNKEYHARKYKLVDIIEHIFHYIKYAIPWNKTIFEESGSTLYYHFKIFRDNNVLLGFYRSILAKYLTKKKKKKLRFISTDTSFSNNQQGIERIGRNKFNKNKNCNKISFLSDSNGVPLSIIIKEGNVHDCKFLIEHFDNLLCPERCFENMDITLLADSAYDSNENREFLKNKGINAIIDYNKRGTKNIQRIKRMSKKEKGIYKKRMIIGNSFSWIKKCRRCLNRYDKLFSSYFNSAIISMIILLMNKIPKYLI